MQWERPALEILIWKYKELYHPWCPVPTIPIILYNYRLLMRSTSDYKDRVRYWLTEAVGRDQPIPDKVYMVLSRLKSKVSYCFIKLSRIFLHKDWLIHNYWNFNCTWWGKSSVATGKNTCRNLGYTAKCCLWCTHTEVHSSNLPSWPIRDQQNRGRFLII